MPVYLYTGEWQEYDHPFATKMLSYAAAGASHLVLAFHVYTEPWAEYNYTSGSVKQLYEMPEAERKDLLNKLHSVGTEVILSTGGESAGQVWVDTDPAEYAQHFCGMAAELEVDGVDFDLEYLPALFGQSLSDRFPKWNTDVIAECKKHFNGYITSAPQTPYVMPAWAGEYGYDKYGFDRLLIQYYNQGTWSNEHVKDGMFGSSSGSIPDLMKRNPDAPKDRFVVGKPLIAGDGNDSATFTDEELKAWGCEAWANLGWRGGFMFWMGHWDNPLAQMKVKLFSAPCPGEDDTPVTTSSTTTTPPTQPPTEVPTEASTTAEQTPPPTQPPTSSTTSTTPQPPTSSTTSTTPQPPTDGPTPAPTVSGDVAYDTICEGGSPSDPVNAACIARVTKDPGWVATCQANCLTLGPGGCLQKDFFTSYDGSVDSVLACVSANYPYCSY
jgi:chitinase